MDLDGVTGELLSADSAVVEDIVANGIIAFAAEAVGAMNVLLRQTVEYGATRNAESVDGLRGL